MTKKELIHAAINGEKPERLPYSFWTHMPDIDMLPEKIAEKTYEFYKKYDFDFIKTMNSGMYAIEDFGCRIDTSDIARGGVAKIVYTPVGCASDLKDLKECSCDEGTYKRELTHLRLVLDKVKGEEVPVITTVFTPLTTLDKLCGQEDVTGADGQIVKRGRVLSYMQEDPESVHHALEVITRTTERFAARAIELGADGIFLASQMSTYDKCTLAEYKEFGEPYDLRVIAAAKDGWMNTIHCHGDHLIFEILKDYPVQVFNWHAWEALPDVDEAYALTGKCLMGGLNRSDITRKNKDRIQNQIYRCYKSMGGMHQILTPGCVIRYPLDEEMLSYIRKTIDEVETAFKC